MTAPTEHEYPAAAELLGISEKWLRENIAKLPHYKKALSTRGSGKVTFTDEHLDEIRRTIFEHRPAEPVRRGPVTRRRAGAA